MFQELRHVFSASCSLCVRILWPRLCYSILILEFGDPEHHLTACIDSSASSTTQTTLNAAQACDALEGEWYSSSLAFWQSVASAADTGQCAIDVAVVADVEIEYDASYSFSTIPGFPASVYVKEIVASYVIWESATTWLTTNFNTMTIVDYSSFTVPFPDCPSRNTSTISTASQQANASQCSSCLIVAEGVQLIYWPVKTVPGYPNLTISHTGPLTGYFSGTPFTSGSVYLKYNNVGTQGGCNPQGTDLIDGSIVTLTSDEVSSLVGDDTIFGAAESFDFANLNYPVPWMVYAARQPCIHVGARSKHQAGNPYISLPHKFAALTHRGRLALSTRC